MSKPSDVADRIIGTGSAFGVVGIIAVDSYRSCLWLWVCQGMEDCNDHWFWEARRRYLRFLIMVSAPAHGERAQMFMTTKAIVDFASVDAAIVYPSIDHETVLERYCFPRLGRRGLSIITAYVGGRGRLLCCSEVTTNDIVLSLDPAELQLELLVIVL